MRALPTGLVLSALGAWACGSTPDLPPTVPATLAEIERGPDLADDGWAVSAPAAAGFDAAALLALTADIEAGEFPNTHAVIVEQAGSLLYERYFAGTDENWGTDIGARLLGPDDLHDLRSISKSVTAVLLGLALGSDFESAVQQPIGDYLPDLELGRDQSAITLHQLLTMTAGLQANEMSVPYTDPDNDEIRLYAVTDPTRFVLDRPLAHRPGTTWYYFGGLSQVLATVVTQRTGAKLDDYARTALFEPLGITDFEWVRVAYWTPDNPAAASGLRLRARDLAKLGSLFLHGGRWGDRQVVPEDWVRRSSTRHVREIGAWSNDGMWGYGYQWWVGTLPTGEPVVAGVGNGNQRLFVLPDDGLVVTVFAGQYNRFSPHSEAILARVLEARSGG